MMVYLFPMEIWLHISPAVTWLLSSCLLLYQSAFKHNAMICGKCLQNIIL